MRSRAAVCPRGGRRSSPGRRLRQDASCHGVPRQRRDSIQRAGRLHGLRGDGRGAGEERRVPRLRPERLVEREEALLDYVYIERSEIEETGRIRPGGPLRPPGPRHRLDRAKRVVLDTLEVLFAGLPNEGILGPSCAGSSAGSRKGASPPIITGERGDEHPHPPRPRGIRRRLRHPPRSPGHRPDFHAAPAGRQVPRLLPRHERVPLPHRQGRHLRTAHHLLRAYSTTRPRSGSPPASRGSTPCSPARAIIRGSSILVSGTAGTGKSSHGRPVRRSRLRERRAVPLPRLRGIPKPDHTQHGLHRASTWNHTWTRRASSFDSVRPTLFGLEMHLAPDAQAGR